MNEYNNIIYLLCYFISCNYSVNGLVCKTNFDTVYLLLNKHKSQLKATNLSNSHELTVSAFPYVTKENFMCNLCIYKPKSE